MAEDKFEKGLKQLKVITQKLNKGMGLEDTINEYAKGKATIKRISTILNHENERFAKIEKDDGTEVPFNRDKNGKDITNKAKVPKSDTKQESTKQGQLF